LKGNGFGVAVNTAGTPANPAEFLEIVRNVTTQSQKHLVSPRRLFMTGGLLTLTVPKTNGVRVIELPNLPSFVDMYKVHVANLKAIQQFSVDLNWTFMCPGQMSPGELTPGLVSVAEELPMDITQEEAKDQASIFPLLMKQFARFNITYDDLANFVAEQIASGSTEFVGKCTGHVQPSGSLPPSTTSV